MSSPEFSVRQVVDAGRYLRGKEMRYKAESKTMGTLGVASGGIVAFAIATSNPITAALLGGYAATLLTLSVYYAYKQTVFQEEANRVENISNHMMDKKIGAMPAAEVLGEKPQRFRDFLPRLFACNTPN